MSKYKSQNQDVGQAFEPRRGSTLLERHTDFAGKFKKLLMRLSALCYSQQEDNRTRQINQKRRITETGQAFEPRRGSTLLERFSGFCGEM